MCISNIFPGDDVAAGSMPTLGEPIIKSDLSLSRASLIALHGADVFIEQTLRRESLDHLNKNI